jgi:hypothetical protein
MAFEIALFDANTEGRTKKNQTTERKKKIIQAHFCSSFIKNVD